MNSLLIHPDFNTKNRKKNMETRNCTSETAFKELYTIEWSDIENTEADYDNYLNNLKNVFRQGTRIIYS